MIKILVSLLIIIGISSNSFAQNVKISNSINWKQFSIKSNTGESNQLVKFQGAYHFNKNVKIISGHFIKINYIPLSKAEIDSLGNHQLPDTTTLNIDMGYERKKTVLFYSFLPVRTNPTTGIPEKVDNFEIEVVEGSTKSTLKSQHIYADQSLLATGDWYKIKIDTSGIFKLTYEQLAEIGLSKPENVRLYSYGGKQLPLANSDSNYDDLVEIPVKMEKGSDGVFSPGDYILFYGEGTITWDYDSKLKMFVHKKHNFSNYTYLFLTDSFGPQGLKIKEVDTRNLISNQSTNSFDSYRCHEINRYNLIQSGRTWFGEKFYPGTSESFSFDFPDILSSDTAKIYTNIAGRKEIASQTCYFNITNDGKPVGRIDIISAYGNYVYAYEYARQFEILNPASNLNIKYDFIGSSSVMEGYIDFICVNAREKLKMDGSQFSFRDIKTAARGKITNFEIENEGKNLTVWDITNSELPFQLKLNQQNSITSFKSVTDTISEDTIREFVVFDGSGYFTPIIKGDDLGQINNQNLHGLKPADMIIITHPDFKVQADELAEFHRTLDHLSVIVTEPQYIYNEFSSGTPDITAIRNFVRMFYDRATSENEIPKYLLLFGDGSYDNWTTGPENSNFIPTYESVSSVSETDSYVSDDYYGLLDDGEGEINLGFESRIYGLLDIGIGRFPVRDTVEAQLMINKIKHYYSKESFGDWKTKICFIGDDGDNKDGTLHMGQADNIAENIVRKNHNEYNINKIYLDAYKQISTPSGQRVPDVTKDINEKVDQGSLIIDYVGHGNPRILTHEEVLGIPDVRSWTNWDKLSLFITASCEVGRYDDYSRYSLGEWFILTPNGGGIAAITTTRVVTSGGNNALNESIFNNAFNRNLSLGDIIKIAKNNRPPSEINHRNFSLLGDPAVKLSIPENKIVIGNLNRNFLPTGTQKIASTENESQTVLTYEPGDTINALSKALVEGFIESPDSVIIEKDGILYITVYDKIDSLYTFGQDNAPMEFNVQNKVLYKGKASIKKGFFSFEFIMPKDINYKFGRGKISMYAVLDSMEAIGYSENIIIGGNSKSADNDISGPEINLYMNDTLFVNGGLTNENPVLLAYLTDNTGINTTGIGFGHNITAILDGNQDNIYMLNNFYQGNIDEYNSGIVTYPFTNLTPGYHSIEFKTWDIYNNNNTATIEFYVQSSNNPVIQNMYNYPNPFYDETEFRFDHNQASTVFDITIRIYDLMGNKVRDIYSSNINNGYTIAPISWDGTNNVGAKLPRGMYIYRAEISTADGRKTTKSSKLMIFK